jgi:hypothetical protein
MKRRKTALLTAILLPLSLVLGYWAFIPDDCESNYTRVKIGMTEAMVNREMSRTNLMHLIMPKPQRLRRAYGRGSTIEQWYVDLDTNWGNAIGVGLAFDDDGLLVEKALNRNGEWIKSDQH